MKPSILIPLFLLLFVACQSASDQATENNSGEVKLDLQKYYDQGDQVAKLAQKTLLDHVSTALREGGPGHAISYCNIQAGPLMDSLAGVHACTIQRVSDRNRNPGNSPSPGPEAGLMEAYVQRTMVGDTVLVQDGNAVFYKPIVLGLEACLQCHGQPGTDIADATLQKIQSLYPEDRATGYHMNDVRGMWKIAF